MEVGSLEVEMWLQKRKVAFRFDGHDALMHVRVCGKSLFRHFYVRQSAGDDLLYLYLETVCKLCTTVKVHNSWILGMIKLQWICASIAFDTNTGFVQPLEWLFSRHWKSWKITFMLVWTLLIFLGFIRSCDECSKYLFRSVLNVDELN